MKTLLKFTLEPQKQRRVEGGAPTVFDGSVSDGSVSDGSVFDGSINLNRIRRQAMLRALVHYAVGGFQMARK